MTKKIYIIYNTAWSFDCKQMNHAKYLMLCNWVKCSLCCADINFTCRCMAIGGGEKGKCEGKGGDDEKIQWNHWMNEEELQSQAFKGIAKCERGKEKTWLKRLPSSFISDALSSCASAWTHQPAFRNASGAQRERSGQKPSWCLDKKQ